MPFDNLDTDKGVSSQVQLETFPSFAIAFAGCRCLWCQRESRSQPPTTGWMPGPTPTPELRRIITEARQLVVDGWTQSDDARKINGRWYYCARGALRKVIGAAGTASEEEAMRHLGRFTPLYGSLTIDVLLRSPETVVVGFNDWQITRQADVVAVFDRALAA